MFIRYTSRDSIQALHNVTSLAARREEAKFNYTGVRRQMLLRINSLFHNTGHSALSSIPTSSSHDTRIIMDEGIAYNRRNYIAPFASNSLVSSDRSSHNIMNHDASGKGAQLVHPEILSWRCFLANCNPAAISSCYRPHKSSTVRPFRDILTESDVGTFQIIIPSL